MHGQQNRDELAEHVRAFMNCQNLPTDVMPSIRMFRQAQEDDLLARINRSCGQKELARHMGIRRSREPARNLAQVVKDIQAFAQQQGPARSSEHMPRLMDLKQAGKHELASHVTHFGSFLVAKEAGLTTRRRRTRVS